MSLEDIQSPLPARRVEVQEPVAPPEVPVVEAEAIDRTTISQQVQKQKENFFKKYLIWIIGFFVLILVVFLVVFLRKNMKPLAVNKVELNYWGLWEEGSVMEGVIADFEAKNPNIKVNYKKNSQENYKVRLQNKLAKTGVEGETDIPDIFRIHNTWLPVFKNELAIVPTDTATKIGLDTDFYDVYKKTLKAGSNYKAIPLMYDGLALFYNKNLIESAGIGAPKTWNDLRVAAEKITKRDEQTDKIVTAGAALGSVNNVDN